MNATRRVKPSQVQRNQERMAKGLPPLGAPPVRPRAPKLKTLSPQQREQIASDVATDVAIAIAVLMGQVIREESK